MKRLFMGTMLLVILFVNAAAWAGHAVPDLSGHHDPVQDYGAEDVPEREDTPLEAAEVAM